MSEQPRSAEQFVVRLPNGLRDKVKERASQNFRSMNAEIVYRLLQAYDETKKADALAS